jgi:hypothetical protein
MRRLIALFLAAFCAHEAIAATHDVGYGTFEAPDDFAFKHTGTIDSFRGTLTRKSDGFTISFDIGLMAGTHMSPSKKEKCVFYRTHKINDSFAFTGIERTNGTKTIATTIWDHLERSRVLGEETKAMFKLPEPQREQTARQLHERYEELKKDKQAPANFWAEIKGDSDMAEFLLLVSSYKPKAPANE